MHIIYKVRYVGEADYLTKDMVNMVSLGFQNTHFCQVGAFSQIG
jgi:hypothetical protein